MKRLLFAGLASLPLLLQPTYSHAVIVECANCSDITNQLIEKATQAGQYAMQAEQKLLQGQQYLNQLQNTMQLPMQFYGNVTNNIQSVRSLANAASLLTGNSGSIMARLQSAQGYANQAMYTPQQIGGQFTMWQQTLSNANNSLGRTLGLQQSQEISNAAMQARIQALTPQGQVQAIQQTNQLAALTNTQLQQIQTTLTATAQASATRDLVEADRKASEDAALQRMLQGPPIEVNGYRSY